MWSHRQEEANKERLVAQFEAMYQELYEWREAHPEASFDEIASQVTPLRRRLIGELLEQLARQHGNGRVVEDLVCEVCGEVLEYKGEPQRDVEHLEGESKLKRAYYYCARCEGGIFPLDRRLKLVEHSWTPETIKAATRLGLEIASYRRAAEAFQATSKIPMSKSSLAELVNEYGGRLVDEQDREAEATVRAPAQGEEMVWREIPEPASEVMNVSVDGVLINIRDEGWKEVKMVTISAVEATVALERDEEKEIRLTHHSYRAGLWDAKQFAKQQWAEGCRRGLEKARQIVSVNDGAPWIWPIIAMCYSPCVEIIDWWHLVEKVWAAANTLFGQGESQARAWVTQAKSRLWTSQRRTVVHQVRQVCPRGQPLPEAVRAMISYIFHNRRRMDYADYRQAGYPVGSGSVESGCKVVVQARMKQAGMRWRRERAQAVLALRSVLLSGRWDELWHSSILLPQLT